VSAKTSENVEKAFIYLATKLIDKYELENMNKGKKLGGNK